MQHVLVLGGGSFGTALAQLFARRGIKVSLHVRTPGVAAAINQSRRNPNYLSEFALHANITATACLKTGMALCDTIVSGLPSHALRDVMTELSAHLGAPRPLIIGTKGIEPDTLMTMDEVTQDVLGDRVAPFIVALSGPSFAREMMREHPTAVVLACRDEALAQRIAQPLFCETFRPYCSTDVVGVEMGGALKNIMALAAGALVGLGLGDNSRAAMITRGIAEISRLAIAKGGDPLTLMGLAGVGDLVLTCTGALSRNRAVGEAMGRGLSLQEACAQVGQVAEGIGTTKAAFALAQKLNVQVPITRAVYQVLYKQMPAAQALQQIMQRAPGRELTF